MIKWELHEQHDHVRDKRWLYICRDGLQIEPDELVTVLQQMEEEIKQLRTYRENTELLLEMMAGRESEVGGE